MDQLDKELGSVEGEIGKLKKLYEAKRQDLATLSWKRDVLLNGTGQNLVDAVLVIAR